jgi:hypothetical protein
VPHLLSCIFHKTSLTKSINLGVGTQGQLGEKAAEFKKIFRDEVHPWPFMNLHGCLCILLSLCFMHVLTSACIPRWRKVWTHILVTIPSSLQSDTHQGWASWPPIACNSLWPTVHLGTEQVARPPALLNTSVRVTSLFVKAYACIFAVIRCAGY